MLSARKPGERGGVSSLTTDGQVGITFHAGESCVCTKVVGEDRGEEGVVELATVVGQGGVATSNITVDGEELVGGAGEVQEDFVSVVAGNCGFHGEGCTVEIGECTARNDERCGAEFE